MILNSGLMVKKNIRYILSRLPEAPAGQGLDRIYLIFKKITKPELRLATLYAQFKDSVTCQSRLLDLPANLRLIQVFSRGEVPGITCPKGVFGVYTSKTQRRSDRDYLS